MFTQIINGKRQCCSPDPYITAWNYVKGILNESGFSCVQEASSKEYVMKGCDGKIIVYVKFEEESKSKVVFINQIGTNLDVKLYWEDRKNFQSNGEFILFNIRNLWASLTKLSE